MPWLIEVDIAEAAFIVEALTMEASIAEVHTMEASIGAAMCAVA
ncbi:MAG: hypothetical protein WDN46_25600 [Methylocella sp.]